MDMNGLMFGKTAPIRLEGKALEQLRRDCYQRDGGICRVCGVAVTDYLPDWHPHKYQMMHVKSRGANGADVIENVLTGCGECHRLSHAGKIDLREYVHNAA